MSERIAVIGLGYVGLQVAVALARRFPSTIGFDVNRERLGELATGVDRNHEVSAETLRDCGLKLASDPSDLADRTFFVVAVPTPVDRHNRPDLSYLLRASALVGTVLKPGALVVYESTVYPGATEEVCGPALAPSTSISAIRQSGSTRATPSTPSSG